MAGLANEMEVPRLPVGVLEAEAPFAEIDLARDAGVDHPLQRPVDRGPAHAMVFALDQFDQIVRAEVALLAEKHSHDEIALARPLRTSRTKPIEIW